MEYKLKPLQATLASDGTMRAAVETVDKNGKITGTKFLDLPQRMTLAQAKATLTAAQANVNARGDSVFRAVASIVSEFFATVTNPDNLPKDDPKERAKAISERIRNVLHDQGVNAKGRGNVAGQYTSVISRYVAAGGSMEIEGNYIPPERAMRIQVFRADHEIAAKLADGINNDLQTALDNYTTAMQVQVWNAISERVSRLRAKYDDHHKAQAGIIEGEATEVEEQQQGQLPAPERAAA